MYTCNSMLFKDLYLKASFIIFLDFPNLSSTKVDILKFIRDIYLNVLHL